MKFGIIAAMEEENVSEEEMTIEENDRCQLGIYQRMLVVKADCPCPIRKSLHWLQEF